MVIEISSGLGTGPTSLAAFDSALIKAGIGNYNLIRLSSVIPNKSQIKQVATPSISNPKRWGDKLYLVMAEMRVDEPNEEAWAGIGWVQDKETGKGLFVEHEGKSEHYVEESIHKSLEALMTTRKVDYSPIHMKIEGITCKDKPVCAVVAAIYKTTNWEGTQ